MAKNVKITNQGLSLLASSSQATGQYYWLGYYALAYVPNLWKSDSVVLPPADTCNNVNGTPTIESTDTDNISASMTRLTKYGDIIYNVWQGDLNGTGYAGGVSDGSPGGDLFGLSMYDKNIKKHYRYVLDSNGNNTLVTWVNNTTKTDGSMSGKHVYKGTDAFTYSELPIPAPLYYLGDITGKTSVDDYFDAYPTFEDENYNGALIYPYITVILKDTGDELLVPKVSTDFRGYNDSLGNPATLPYPTAGIYFNSSEIPATYSLDYDETGWFAGNNTWGVGTTDDDYYYCNEFWKLHTISNYNRFHAPVNSIGHVLSSDLSNRNMSKVTKFFPISNYKVINTETKFTSNAQSLEVATAIKLGINIELSPTTLSTGFDSDGNLDENSNIEFFDAYANAGDSDILDQYNQSIYKSTHTSFKFNRIGIYAVPMRTAAYVADEGFGVDNTSSDKKLQFQINPDEEPILFAVVDWDNVVIMGDSGDGIHQFIGEINLNLQSPDDADSTALIRDASIFYNLYQDDAQTWYQNQLIANASTSNAITEFGLELAHLKKLNKLNKESGCCPPPDLSDLYASKNHTHNFMRNLLDANVKVNGGLKGIDTAPEDSKLDSQIYKVGHDSVVLGSNTFVSADYSIVGNGVNNYINRDSHRSMIGVGTDNAITYASFESAILAGNRNKISGSSQSMIGTANITDIINARRSVILAGDTHQIRTEFESHIVAEYDTILNGVHNLIINSKYGNIFNGTNNSITDSNNATIIDGTSITITQSNHALIGSGNVISIDQSDRAFIANGDSNYIGAGSNDAFIGTGKTNRINSLSPYSAIVSGFTNSIYESIGSLIGAGTEHYLNGNYSGILTGYKNMLRKSIYSVIGGGIENYIDNSDDCFIGGGFGNYIIASNYSFVGGGYSNFIGDGTNSSILGGSSNRIYKSINSSILDGSSNYISVSEYSSIIGGYDNTIANRKGVAVFGYGIIANRSHAFITNSLTLYNSTIELYDQTPYIGYVMRVSNIVDNVARIEWDQITLFSNYIEIEAKANNYIHVINNGKMYNISCKDGVSNPNIWLDHINMSIGDTCIINVDGAPGLNWKLIFNHSSNQSSLTAEIYSTVTISTARRYSFMAVKSRPNQLKLIGDYGGLATT